MQILVDKPAEMTSFGVVARVRRVLSQKKQVKRVKVGHTGTLDPFATGLLILMTEKDTKKCQEFLKLDKVYEATIRLGATSTTGDPEGEITTTIPETQISEEEVKKVVQSFHGKITQKLPIYSAVKVNGERAYKLARKGAKVEMPEREVEIYEIEVLNYEWPYLKIRAHVSSGTYIRTLGEDIGARLGVGGYLTELRRMRIGEYKIEDAKALEEVMEEIERG